MPKYYAGKKITRIYRGGGGGTTASKVAKVYKGTQLIHVDFDAFGPFPRYKPPYGYFKLTAVDVNNNPLANIPVIPRYGGRSIALKYSYDNITWNDMISGNTVNTSSTGILYLKCMLSGNRQVSVDSSRLYNQHCWKVGDSTSVYYKIEGDLRMLMDSALPADMLMATNCFYILWCNFYYLNNSATTPYINQILDANVIIPGAADSRTSHFAVVFGNKMKRACLWKDGRWCETNPSNEYREWSNLFNWTGDFAPMEQVQLNFKSWPTTATGQQVFSVKTPANTTFYIPNELPAEYGDRRLPTGCTISRYNVDAYGTGKS